VSPATTWAQQVRDALPVRARRHWAPVGSDALRQGGVLVTAGRPLPVSAGSLRAWFVVPVGEATAFWAAWQRAGSDPASPELTPWRELVVEPQPQPAARNYVTRRGRELRYRAPGARFGDPTRGDG
jgi:hypothetical protein